MTITSIFLIVSYLPESNSLLKSFHIYNSSELRISWWTFLKALGIVTEGLSPIG